MEDPVEAYVDFMWTIFGPPRLRLAGGGKEEEKLIKKLKKNEEFKKWFGIKYVDQNLEGKITNNDVKTLANYILPRLTYKIMHGIAHRDIVDYAAMNKNHKLNRKLTFSPYNTIYTKVFEGMTSTEVGVIKNLLFHDLKRIKDGDHNIPRSNAGMYKQELKNRLTKYTEALQNALR